MCSYKRREVVSKENWHPAGVNRKREHKTANVSQAQKNVKGQNQKRLIFFKVQDANKRMMMENKAKEGAM